MNIKNIISLFFLVVLIQSCGEASYDKNANDFVGAVEEEIVPVAMPHDVAPPPPPVKKQEVIKKKIIKDGRLGLKVDDIEKAKAQIDTLVKAYDGYYSNERFNNTESKAFFNLEIRIPSERFETFISNVEKGKGEVLYKEIDARDVTDQFIDLETRLKNKKSYLVRYNELLKEANTVKEILEIQEEIRQLEEEIESTTGRLKYLTDQVDYSTLNLNLEKQKDFTFNPADRDEFTERLKQSLSKGWYGFVDFILFLFKIWPLWVVVGVIVFVWRRIRKRRKK